MSVVQELKKRFSPQGSHRVVLNKLKALLKVYPDSQLLKETIAVAKKKIYSAPGADFLLNYQKKLLFKNLSGDDILDINNIKFNLKSETVKSVFCLEYIDLFSSDPLFRNAFSDDKELQSVLAAFETEGPYQKGAVVLNEEDVVIDAGSNMGMFALMAAKYKKCHVYAFEPSDEVLPLLSENILNNGLQDHITVCPYGLSHSDYTTSFFIDDENFGGSSILEKESNSRNEKTINCVSLDNWVEKNNIKKIDFIKADIEGAERFLLQGAVKVLREMHPKLSICTYHLPDDPQVLTKIILDANPDYSIEYGKMKLYAHVK